MEAVLVNLSGNIGKLEWKLTVAAYGSSICEFIRKYWESLGRVSFAI